MSMTVKRQSFYPHRPKITPKITAAADASHLSPTAQLTYQLTVIDISDKQLVDDARHPSVILFHLLT